RVSQKRSASFFSVLRQWSTIAALRMLDPGGNFYVRITYLGLGGRGMFLLSAVALLSLVFPFPATVVWHKSFSLMGRPEIRVASSNADVRVYASDRNDVEAVLYTDRAISTDAVTDRESGKRLELNVKVPNQWEAGFSHGSAVLELKIPLACDVD